MRGCTIHLCLCSCTFVPEVDLLAPASIYINNNKPDSYTEEKVTERDYCLTEDSSLLIAKCDAPQL
jgi:hypothetical protein